MPVVELVFPWVEWTDWSSASMTVDELVCD